MNKNCVLILTFLFGLVLGLTSCTVRDKAAIELNMREAIQQIANSHDSVYLADSVLQEFFYDYGYLKNQVPDADTNLLRSILDSGKKIVFEPHEVQRMLQPLSIKLITYNQFWQVEMPKVTLTHSEDSVARRIDSLSNEIGKLDSISPPEQALVKEQSQLMTSAEWRSFFKKLARSSKRLLIVGPVLKFKRHALIVIDNYHSLTDNHGIIRVVSW